MVDSVTKDHPVLSCWTWRQNNAFFLTSELEDSGQPLLQPNPLLTCLEGYGGYTDFYYSIQPLERWEEVCAVSHCTTALHKNQGFLQWCRPFPVDTSSSLIGAGQTSSSPPPGWCPLVIQPWGRPSDQLSLLIHPSLLISPVIYTNITCFNPASIHTDLH